MQCFDNEKQNDMSRWKTDHCLVSLHRTQVTYDFSKLPFLFLQNKIISMYQSKNKDAVFFKEFKMIISRFISQVSFLCLNQKKLYFIFNATYCKLFNGWMRRAVASFSLHLIQDVILEDSVQSGEEKQGIKEKYGKREISCMGEF